MYDFFLWLGGLASKVVYGGSDFVFQIMAAISIPVLIYVIVRKTIVG